MTSLLKLCRSSRIALNSIHKSHTIRWMPSTMKYFCVDSKSSSDKKSASATKPITAIRSEYVPISERNATIILDVEEEREKMRRGEIEIEEKDDTEQYRGLNTERGVHGVFDIEDLVEVLRKDNAKNIFVCRVSPELKYVDYVCVVSARSVRHMKAIAEFVRKMYKVKRLPNESVPRIEGQDSNDWVAIDLGNIALHILSDEARVKYDIEQLWSVGREFDAETNKPADIVVQMLERHEIFLSDLQPSAKDEDEQEEEEEAAKRNDT